ncbi:hypothetical protein HN51_070687, partial [Arachis hypogaea]
HLPHNFLLPYRDLSPIFLFSPFASCGHSRFVFLDRFLDYSSSLSVGKLCIKMKMYKRSIENGASFGSEIANGFH